MQLSYTLEMKIVKPTYLIVDFSAGSIVTHHLNYVVTYAKFIENSGYTVKLVLPKYTPNDKSLNDFKVFRVLQSREYRINQSRISILRIYHFFIKSNNVYGKILEYMIGRITIKIYLLLAMKELIKIVRLETSECAIIFPSADLMAIRFMDMLLNKKINIKAFFVRINAVDKNLINKDLRLDGLMLLDRLLGSNKKIYIGCETKSLIRSLRKRGEIYNNVCWIPLPSVSRIGSSKNRNVIGFLGGAKKRKGFDEIPQWIAKIKSVNPDALFIIQTSPFPWPGYEKTIKALNQFNNIELISPVINNEELFKQISRCSYMITPYNKESYTLVGSSIFYYASDFLIPTISYNDLGFSDDIFEYQCGILVENMSENFEVDLFNHETREKLVNKLIGYNGFRNSQNLLFLKLI